MLKAHCNWLITSHLLPLNIFARTIFINCSSNTSHIIFLVNGNRRYQHPRESRLGFVINVIWPTVTKYSVRHQLFQLCNWYIILCYVKWNRKFFFASRFFLSGRLQFHLIFSFFLLLHIYGDMRIHKRKQKPQFTIKIRYVNCGWRKENYVQQIGCNCNYFINSEFILLNAKLAWGQAG